MKVAEKDSDRTAEVHLRADGVFEELEEFGEHIDEDGAICSYVPMEEGQVIKFEAKFSGTTIAITYDAVIDGVLRASNLFKGKNVSTQKNKKLTHDKFLYQKEDDVIYTSMKAVTATNLQTQKQDGPEHVGMLEFRLYVLRQFGEEHSITKGLRYDNLKDRAGGKRGEEPLVTYTAIEPDLKMTFEEDSPEISDNHPAIKRLDKPRPGSSPWAIFRFKYRTRDSILAQKLPLTFDRKEEVKGETHTIDLGPVPALNVGDKPTEAKDKDDLTPTTSVPATPLKGVGGALTPASATSKTQSSRARRPGASEEQDPPTSARSAAISRWSTTLDESIDAEVNSSRRSKKQSSDLADTSATETQAENQASSKAPIIKDGALKDDAGEKESSSLDGTSKKSLQINGDTHAEPANAANQSIPPNKAQQQAQECTKPTTLANDEPAEISTTTYNIKTPGSATTTSTTKRAGPSQGEHCPEPKRHHTNSYPTPTRTSTPVSTVSSTKTPSLSEMRKSLEKTRSKRQQLAQRQADLSQKLEQYKTQMEEELARLNKELEAETRLLREEAVAYKEDLAMFEDFKKRDGAKQGV